MENTEHIIDMEIQEATEPPKLTTKEILTQIFTSPAKGTYTLFEARHSNSSRYGVIFILIFGLVAMLMPYLIKRTDLGLKEIAYLIKLGVCAIAFTSFISMFTFVVNAVAKRIDLGKALLTGGTVSLTLSLACIIVYFVCLLSGSSFAAFLYNNDADSGNIKYIWVFIIIYSLLLVFNIVLQSLRAGKEKDGASFYLFPIIILFSFYLALRLAHMII